MMTNKARLLAAFLAATLSVATLTGDSPAESPFVPVGADKKFKAPRLKDFRSVDPVPERADWKLEVKPYSAPKVVSKNPISLDVPADHVLGGFALNRGGDRALIATKTKGGDTTQVITCDLAKGRVLRKFEVPGAWNASALSDDGDYAVLRKFDAAKGKKDTLQIWNVAEKDPALQLEFVPYPYFPEALRDIQFVAWLPDNRLMTLCNKALVVWDLKTGQPHYWLSMQAGTYPSLSPDRKRLAFTTETSVGVLDVDEGKVLVSQPVPQPLPTSLLAFNPDGTRLACRGKENIFIWNMADGSLYRDMPKSELPGNIFRWTSPKDLLVGTHLVDVELPMSYWEYKGTYSVHPANGVTWFVTRPAKGDGVTLISAEIPRTDAIQALKKATTDPTVLVLKAGTKVKLDVSKLKEDERERAAEALTKALEKNNFKVDPSGTVTLVASTDSYPEPIELKYRHVEKKGDKTGPVEKYPFHVHFARLRFVYNGSPIWQSSAHNLPGDIELEVGESVESRLKMHEKPKYEFFQTAVLPRVLLRTKGEALLGSSQVTPAGIR
jgi:hypothetical protein